MLSSVVIGYLILVALEAFWQWMVVLFLEPSLHHGLKNILDSPFISILLLLVAFGIAYVGVWVFLIMPNLHRSCIELTQFALLFGVVIMSPLAISYYILVGELSYVFILVQIFWGSINIAITAVLTRMLLLNLNKI